jgi:hypothetical protein
MIRHLYLPGFARPATYTYRVFMCWAVDKSRPATYTYRVLLDSPPIPTGFL